MKRFHGNVIAAGFACHLLLPFAFGQSAPPATAAADEPVVQLERFVTEGRSNDPFGILPTEPVDSIFGFKKTLLDTPRSVSSLSDDLMTAYGIESALDVTKLVPSTFTTSIFGINGNVNIRGIPSDTYFRGVKRLENTQMFPSPITAMSRLDVVRGPPSPVFGPGKVGGYSNFIPKSARAQTGKYLERPTGKAVFTFGSYAKKAASFEVGGPFSIGGRRGGYYVYLNAEDSDTYYDHVPFRQYIAQSSFDLELADHVRLEFGQMYQHWAGTELAGWNRITQQLIDTGMYTAGTVLVNMDANGDGLISTAEVDVYGPLLRTFAPTATAAQVSAALPASWQIDPATVALVPLSRRANSQSPEDGGQANINLAYFDVIVELPDGARVTSKTYAEYMNRYKWTRASAYGQDTSSFVAEQKIVYEKAFTPGVDWLDLNFSGSALARFYDTYTVGGSKYADLVTRADISQPLSPKNRFAVPNLEPHLAPWNTGLRSNYTTTGFGTLLDVTVLKKTNLVLGSRYDWIDMYSKIPNHVLTTPGLRARNGEEGFSWSVSGSHEVAKGVRPYGSFARQETLVIGIDGGIGVGVVPTALNTAELREAGIKASLFENKLFAAASAFRQTRSSFSQDTGQVLSTLSRGIEFELRWVPSKRLSFTGGGTWQKTTYAPVRASTISVNPAFFGLPGNFYGGRLQTTLTAEPDYAERSGYPDKVINLNSTYSFDGGWTVNLSSTYREEVPSGRIKDIILPDAVILGLSVSKEFRRWAARLSVNNLTDELYFTPNSPDGLGEVIVIPAPERNFTGSITYKF